MHLVRFLHKGLRPFHEDGSAKGGESAVPDKLRKLLFAMERVDTRDNQASFRDGGCTRSRAI